MADHDLRNRTMSNQSFWRITIDSPKFSCIRYTTLGSIGHFHLGINLEGATANPGGASAPLRPIQIKPSLDSHQIVNSEEVMCYLINCIV